MNNSAKETRHTFAHVINATLTGSNLTNKISLSLKTPIGLGDIMVQPGSFAKMEYSCDVPNGIQGQVVLNSDGITSSVLEIGPPAAEPSVTSAPPAPIANSTNSLFTPPGLPKPPLQYFREHLSIYEPVYFIAGPQHPSAKFQFSLKYRLFDPDKLDFPLHFGYTQTSLWDIFAPSAPFYDTSYKPSAFLLFENVFDSPTNYFAHVNLQGGFEHESNGRGDAGSRSMNTVYFQPTLILGNQESFHLALMPRVWFYIMDLSDNPDIAQYRGYADLITTVGWKEIQLEALTRLGDTGKHLGIQLDLTVPVPIFGFRPFFQAQYYNGYGESLLGYNQRTDVFRLGFSLYRRSGL